MLSIPKASLRATLFDECTAYPFEMNHLRFFFRMYDKVLFKCFSSNYKK